MAAVNQAPNRAHAFAGALFEELSRAGVRDVCVSPGSRSTPLAAAAATTPSLRCFSQIDERSAAFFALGLARRTRTPVALVCTSGTAAANYLPAVIEAHYARVPLIVLSADRPHELREWGAGQTIDQVHLYGRHVRWFAEAPLAEATRSALRHVRALACRAVAAASGRPPGPVHLNLPFREPLEPAVVAGDVPGRLDALAAEGRATGPYARVADAAARPAPEEVARLARLVREFPRGVIACGPLDGPVEELDAIASLARAAAWPLLAEPTSQLRCGAHVDDCPVVSTADLLLRDERFAGRLAPDVVLRVGDTPTSKAFRLWLERHAPHRVVLADPDGAWHDPSHLASDVLHVHPAALAEATERLLGDWSRPEPDRGWQGAWIEADARAAATLDRELAEEAELLEPRAARELADALPDDAVLYVSNSMPVRDLDAFLPARARPLRVLCNRGANGIDGVLSSACGAAAGGEGPLVLLTGDLAFLHDLGGLLAVRRHGLRLVIVVLQNDGGGIFSFLPVARHPREVGFEEHFLTPHGLDFQPLARAFGLGFERVTSWEHYRTALKEALAAPGSTVIEVPVDRERNVAHQRRLQRAVADAVASA